MIIFYGLYCFIIQYIYLYFRININCVILGETLNRCEIKSDKCCLRSCGKECIAVFIIISVVLIVTLLRLAFVFFVNNTFG